MKLTPTQRRILENVRDGRDARHGQPMGMSHAGGWDGSYYSCFRRGWLVAPTSLDPPALTPAGRAALTKDTQP